jgi:hypothetical protein
MIGARSSQLARAGLFPGLDDPAERALRKGQLSVCAVFPDRNDGRAIGALNVESAVLGEACGVIAAAVAPAESDPTQISVQPDLTPAR